MGTAGSRQHTAECSSHTDGTCGKALLTKGKTLVRKGSERKKEFKKQPCKCQWLTGMWQRDAQDSRAEFP